MIRNLFFLFLGTFFGLWIIWPGITTSKAWQCAKDVSLSSKEELTDIESFVESLPQKIKIGLAISPKTLLKRENLTQIEKIRIVGDTCFR